MSNSTPLPWALHSKASFARIVRADSAGRGGGVAQFVHAADAELACRAVNALGPLVAALEHMRWCLPCAEGEWSDCEGGRAATEALRLAGKT